MRTLFAEARRKFAEDAVSQERKKDLKSKAKTSRPKFRNKA
ncbi:hypothetical protein [Jeotgalibacillus proteolyticus]